MTARNVTNCHDAPLSIGGVTIGPGRTARVERWESVSRSNAVRIWVEQGLIDVEDLPEPEAKLPELPGLPGLPSDDENDRKEAIIAQLAELGVEKTKRTSLENLEKALEEARAAG